MTEPQSRLSKSSPERSRRVNIVLLAFILALGIFLRIPPHTFSPGGPLHALAGLHPQPAFTQVGFDEGLYRQYVNALIKDGIISYPDMVEGYIDVQNKAPNAILPPLRFLYIFAAYVWHSVFGCEALEALRYVAAFFSVLTLGLAMLFTTRLRGPTWALGIGALGIMENPPMVNPARRPWPGRRGSNAGRA